jgi:adenosylcobinamide kinase/adenosylcobinamide-phosphate guanylyltransferase
MNSNQNSRKTSFVLGGARSGKSLHAETLAKTQYTASGQLVYLATAQIFDEEMQARIDLHKQRRGPEWVLAEAPVDLVDTLRRFEHPDNVILIDCLSVWMTNLIIGEHDIAAHRDSLIAHLAISISSLIFVASETGLGIVPDNALSRQFRDESGRLNQMVARASDDVFFVTAGIAQKIKP